MSKTGQREESTEYVKDHDLHCLWWRVHKPSFNKFMTRGERDSRNMVWWQLQQLSTAHWWHLHGVRGILVLQKPLKIPWGVSQKGALLVTGYKCSIAALQSSFSRDGTCEKLLLSFPHHKNLGRHPTMSFQTWGHFSNSPLRFTVPDQQCTEEPGALLPWQSGPSPKLIYPASQVFAPGWSSLLSLFIRGCFKDASGMLSVAAQCQPFEDLWNKGHDFRAY